MPQQLLQSGPRRQEINVDSVVRDVVVIGGSAGAFTQVVTLLSLLPPHLPAIIGVVLHRGAQSAADWSISLGSKCKLRTVEPADGERLERGVVYIAPSNRHLRFEAGYASLREDAKEHFTRPAIDPLFTSAARCYGPRVVGVVLTGCGHDGLNGLLSVSTGGGVALVQKPSQAEQPSMPEYSIAHDHVAATLSVHDIAQTLALLVRGEPVVVEPLEEVSPHPDA